MTGTLARHRIGVAGRSPPGPLRDALAGAAWTVGTVKEGPAAPTDPEHDTATFAAMLTAGAFELVAFLDPQSVEDLSSAVGRLPSRGAFAASFACRTLAAAADPPTAAALERRGVPVSVMPLETVPAALATALATWRGRPRVDRGPLRLVPDRNVVAVRAREIGLGPIGFGVLASLVRRPGVACPHRILLRETWEGMRTGDEQRLKHHISRLRRELGDLGTTIATVRQVGYRYDP